MGDIIWTTDSQYGKEEDEDMKRLWKTVKGGRTDGLFVPVMLKKVCDWDTRGGSAKGEQQRGMRKSEMETWHRHC